MEIVCKGPYLDRFSAGDVVCSKIDVNFTNGVKHHIGDRITVTAETVSYYDVHYQYYDKVSK